MEYVRLNKFLSEAGVCSRREADRRIAAGDVTVNGVKAVTGMRLLAADEVAFCGKKVKRQPEQMVLLLFHKPRGIVCTAEKREKNNIVDFIQYPQRIYPVGRLDKDSEGLILMTNQGDLVNKIMRAGNYHEKEYLVQVDKRITEDFINHMEKGVPILDTVTRPCKVMKISSNRFKIVLTQGLNRQIRRMCETLGYEVLHLKRERIMNLKLDGIPVGASREIEKEELKELERLLKYSSSLSWQDRMKEQQQEADTDYRINP